MNNHQLESLLRHLLGDAFCGVWASDQLPLLEQTFRLPAYMIVNTHPGHEPGEHWLALTVEEDGKGTFFDSFGFPPDFSHYPKSILQFLQKRCDTIFYHNRSFQHILSTTCGQHCVYYLCQRARGLSFENVLSLYGEDVLSNDEKVAYFVKKYQRCIMLQKAQSFHHTVCSLQMFLDKF